MAEPKAKTLQQRFGFMDTDMKKPKHDEIMLWLDSIVEARVASWIKYEPEWNSELISRKFLDHRHDFLFCLNKATEQVESSIKDFEAEKAKKHAGFSYYESCCSEKLKDLELLKELHKKATRLERLDPVPAKPPLSNVKKIWECPVKGYNDYIVGFIDLKVTYDYPELILAGISVPVPADLYRISGITWSPKWEVHTIQQGHYPCADPIYFEVKTEIPSLGELIRQINIYREYGAKKIFVVSPDDRYVSVLQEQGIGFIKYIPNK